MLAPPEIARHPHQLAFRRTGRNSQGARGRRRPAARPFGGRKHAFERLAFFFTHGLRYLQHDGEPPADAVRDCGFTGRSRRLVPRSRLAELRAHRTHLRRANEGLTRDDVLDNITLTWLTNTAISAARLYRENKLLFFAPMGVSIPVAVSAFPDEIYQAPAELGGAGVSQAHPLQQARQRRPLRGVGTAGALFGRGSRGLQITAVVFYEGGVHQRARRLHFTKRCVAAFALR